ncbi:MAG: type 1 glutamine amidotransferase [Actinobacteria bacterium]|nr:MAG: type 1 glutamine amidotransferase [Actinomycetota bacterium]
MDVAIVEHQADAHAGLIADWAGERGLETGVVRVHAGDPWPDADAVGRAVVLGSDQSVLERPPWLEGELDWLRRLDGAARAVLGVCFGAQALSAALGGTVAKAMRPEIGWFQIDGSQPVGGTWFQWHSDAFTAPPGARELGRNASGLQSYRLRRHLAIQFHPEVTPAIVDGWISVGGRELAEQALDADEIRARTDREAARAREAAYALFDAWAAG